ncbi:hypothetical protein A2Z53_03095 [Candidatus Giovannonibacteria bacterium RIFCSPHIGHO2_02_42_15]|uniref:UDP-N-acetylmuramoyl-tripeptide--D-alanyl-D-alanine ligase n=2 Tax=Candidatus Giovannoniibacteriota TaxID=1752738 RepID=A0A1F5VK83_9BACT|nr:MAG: hypothetical protein A2Z53_03095 [Candidatus Giovannonibacteria bacterium RIFCSPHIGHO2_02_42_15]
MEILKKIIIAILTFEARMILWKFKPKIVAVTGSVGKTSAKEAIAKTLSYSMNTRKSEKSYNSEVGVPLAIIGEKSGWRSPLKWAKIIWKGFLIWAREKKYPNVLILELGADRPGDIRDILKWLKPDVGVLTALAETPAHVEFFSGPEQVYEEKSELVKSLGHEDKAVLNFDDSEIMKMIEKTDAGFITYGANEDADFVATDYKIIFKRVGEREIPEGFTFKVSRGENEIPVKIFGAFGRHNMYPALSAIAVADIFKIKMEDAAEALSTYIPPPGRLRLIKGIKESLILDDTYNSSPKAVGAALELLKDIPAKRKIVVLGDMLELGRQTIDAHREIGGILPEFVDVLITMGPRAKFFAEAAWKKGLSKRNIFSFSNLEETTQKLKKIIGPENLILIKGSQSMRMEKIVEVIMREPEKKAELLCRQEEEWTSR